MAIRIVYSAVPTITPGLTVTGVVTATSFSGMGATPVGAITMYGGAAAPTGWLLCNGAAVSRTTYAALFAVLSTTFGVGDGATTFNVPDLRDRSPMGANTTVALGATGGALTAAHTHAVGTYAVDSHTHGPGTLTATHNHGVGTYAISSHTHAAGTLAGDSHTHGDGTLAVASHTHGVGTFVVGGHTHALSDSAYAQIMCDSGNDVHARQVSGVTSWTSTNTAVGTSEATAAQTAGTALRGATDSTVPTFTGDSGSASPDVTGNTGAATVTISGSTAAATPTLSGNSGDTDALVNGGVTAGGTATISGTSASTAPSVLHPVLGVQHIIYAGV